MQRDIKKYTQTYMHHDFEHVLVKYRKNEVLKWLAHYKPAKILEVGCGLDPIFQYYSSFDNFYCVEPSDEFFVHAKELAEAFSRVSIRHGFIEDWADELATKNIDFIIISALLHEVIDIDNFIEKIKSICTENTVVHIDVPNALSFHRLWAYEAGLTSDPFALSETSIALQQNRTFSLTTLCDFIEQSGFRILDKGSFFIKPFNHEKMTQCIKREIIDSALLDGLSKMIKYMPDYGCEIFANCRIN